MSINRIKMLIGEYQTKVTDKNRLAVPAELRKTLGKQIVITKGYEGCLIITSAVAFEKFVKPLSEGPFFSRAVRDSTRFLVGSAYKITLDEQGRFVIPPPLKDYSKITNLTVFSGLGNWIELWDQKRWQKRISEVEINASDIAEQLHSLSEKSDNDK